MVSATIAGIRDYELPVKSELLFLSGWSSLKPQHSFFTLHAALGCAAAPSHRHLAAATEAGLTEEAAGLASTVWQQSDRSRKQLMQHFGERTFIAIIVNRIGTNTGSDIEE